MPESSRLAPQGHSSATQADAIRHPIQRGSSSLQRDNTNNESSDQLLKPQDNSARRVSSNSPSESSNTTPTRSPARPSLKERTKTKLIEHELKRNNDQEQIDYLKSQPAEDRHKTVYKNKMARPRWVLHVQAQFWRVLMGLGMFFHRLAPPRPPKHNFMRTIPSTVSSKRGNIDLYFYVPMDYNTQKSLWKDRPVSDDEEDVNSGKQRRSSVGSLGHNLRRRSSSARRWGGYPVVLNFHGGGFTLGSPMDDARWCSTVVDECNAVVIAVDYRLAPEMPFPTAVEDGVDAVIWVHQHAEELGIDPNKIALSGFSSGANMACTVPLRLWDEMMGFPREDETATSHPNPVSKGRNPFDSPESSTSKLPEQANRVELLDPSKPEPPTLKRSPVTKFNMQVREDVLRQVSDISLRAIVPWYPSLDYTRSREQRRATCPRKDQELPALFTDLFDESYLHPPQSISLDSPYLSPGVAPTALLKNGLPQEIILNTCEWDMLLDEGQAFRDRLTSPEIGKNVTYKMIEGVPHGWDKAPNPWKPTPGVREHYLRACKELRRVFGDTGVAERPLSNAGTAEEPVISAAPRGSIQVVN